MAGGGARRALLWGALVAALLAILAAALVERLRRPEPPPYLGAVPDFTLVDHAGRRWTLRDLAGRPWIADFIFTRCADTCPRISERMARLDRELPPEPPLRLVSFSVDPANDRPEVLARYARTYAASPRWSFLTGEPKALYTLIREGFKLGVEPLPRDVPSPPVPITHSTRFVLIDGRARIRGYYDALDPEAAVRLRRDLKAVQQGG